MFTAWMHIRSFFVVRQSEDGVSDQEVVGRTGLQEQQTIVITMTMPCVPRTPVQDS